MPSRSVQFMGTWLWNRSIHMSTCIHTYSCNMVPKEYLNLDWGPGWGWQVNSGGFCCSLKAHLRMEDWKVGDRLWCSLSLLIVRGNFFFLTMSASLSTKKLRPSNAASFVYIHSFTYSWAIAHVPAEELCAGPWLSLKDNVWHFSWIETSACHCYGEPVSVV